MISPEQIQEWGGNPVTEELSRLVQVVIDELQIAKANAFVPGDAGRTQETLAILSGAEGAWESILEALKGGWDYLVEVREDEDERSEGVRH